MPILAAAYALILAAAPPVAASQYHAAPLVTPRAGKVVLKDTIWKCGPAGCAAAARSASRPATVCAAFVRKAGRVESFSAGGVALSTAELGKCNAQAD